MTLRTLVTYFVLPRRPPQDSTEPDGLPKFPWIRFKTIVFLIICLLFVSIPCLGQGK